MQVSALKKRVLHSGMKAATFLVLLTVVFSPIETFFFSPNIARAVDFSEADLVPASEQLQLNLTDDQIHALARERCADKGGYFSNSLCVFNTSQDIRQNVTDSSDPSGLCSSFTSCILLPVYGLTVGLGSFVASVASYFFNVATKLSLTSTAYGLQFVSDGWTAARDIANMFFILILIYIAVTIMLNANTGKTIEMLTWVIFIALIINFSFFITRVVIDTGNIVALQFYNASIPVDAGKTVTVYNTNIPDLTINIMNALGIHTLQGNPAFEQFTKNADAFSQFITLLVLYLFSGAMYFILAAAFFAAGLKFMIRIAVLWLTIIASPLALLAKAANGFEGQYKKWQDTLISHAFYPAVFLFIFWLIATFAGGLKVQGNDPFVQFLASNSNASTVGDSLLNLVSIIANISIRLGFIIVLLFMGMKAADQLGVAGAKWANNIGGKLSFGTGAFAWRNSAGRVAYGISQSKGLQRFAAEGSVAGRLFGRTLLSGSNKLSSSTFDYRAPLGSVAKATGADIGKPTKFGKSGFGFKGSVKEAAAKKASQSERYTNSVTDDEKKAAAKEGMRRAEMEYDSLHPGERSDVVKELESLKKEVEKQTEEQKIANERVETSNKAVKTASQKIQDLDLQGKRGTPEMDAAIAERTRAEEQNAEETRNLGAVTSRLKKAQADQAKVLESQKETENTLADNAKKLKPEMNIRNLYANSLPTSSDFALVANRLAADKIRRGKTSTDHLKEAIEEYGEHMKHEGEHDGGGGGHPTPKPSAPKPASGGGGNGHGGGGHH